ncbi:Vegetative incompatibility protein HET-E-1 [Colletotrichum fructicola]|nr:Vegetative incompatibility protein HET-E-1 [Colletotrichum fructicola]KAF4942676.1 Vegetative incompatibility protein HET-E-1 [Colletotrichum fructicola]
MNSLIELRSEISTYAKIHACLIMIFLRTDTVELTKHISEYDPPLYAVLSHTWGPEEVMYEDLVGDRSKAVAKAGFTKIREACRIAFEEYHLEYLWTDTCCTDRKNEAELNASINSSFRRFRSAALCIAYLSDFDYDPSSAHPKVDNSQLPYQLLRQSRWFTRSWTIQELIAPVRLLFYSRQWELFQERSQLVQLLYHITGIDPYALVGGDPAKIPVARRMYWAASRNATRLEDLAYSLHGLFDVEVAPNYGEGDTNAFIRLQEAILEKAKDPTIFAWRDDWSEEYFTWEKCEELIHSGRLRDYLAKSPAYFSHVGHSFPASMTRNDDGYPGTDIEDLNSDDDDWETSSVASFESSTTPVGSSASVPVRSGLNKAIAFLLENEALSTLFEAAIQKSSIGADRLRRNLARLLRQLGKDLAVEATTKDESLSAVFLRQYRMPIASAITMRASEKYLKPVLLDPSESQALHLKDTIPSDTVLEGGRQDGAEIEAKYEVVDEERDEENEPDDIAPAEKEEAADLDFESISAFILNSSAFASLTRNLSDFVDPSFRSQASKLVARVLEGKDTDDRYWSNMRSRMMTTLTELEESRPQSIFLDVEGTQGIMDKVQIWLESTTGETWNWWPLRPPKYTSSLSEARLGWRCRCGKDRWEVLPAEFAGGIGWLLRKYPFYNRGHGTDASKTSTTTFEKFCRNGFARRGLEVPTTAQKDYYHTPRPALREPPVSPEEFSHIYQFTTKSGYAGSSWTLPFYSCVESLSYDTVGCIPQRYYYLDEKSKRKEDFWGLYIQERRSALMTSFYIVLCLSPFIIFCILYLLGIIQGDV